ncbi:MAG: IS256 family transposase [Pseudomonadota bacterium]
MTKTTMNLTELLEKHDEGDFLRAVAEAVLQLIMETDVEGVIGAGRHERAEGRTTYRNGYRDRALDTRLRTLNLRVLKLRQSSYFPGFLEPRRTSEKALVAVIQEAWIGGVSTRRVDELVQAMGLGGISKSTVSKLCKDIDERVGEFLNRPLTRCPAGECGHSPRGGDWPYVWLDATYLKVRQGGRIVSVAAIIAVAVNTDGRREIIGLGTGPSEAETFWTEFLRGLKARGLAGVKLVVSDAHTGLKAAIARVFEATWQRCRVQCMRTALAHVPRGQHTVVAAAIRQAFSQPDREQAGTTWRHVADQIRARWPKLATLMDESEHDVLAYMAFPAQHRTKLHSTNPIERLNEEMKRRADVVGIFPNEASIMRLIGAVLFEQNDEWATQHRYMQVEAFSKIHTAEPDPILSITTEAA